MKIEKVQLRKIFLHFKVKEFPVCFLAVGESVRDARKNEGELFYGEDDG